MAERKCLKAQEVILQFCDERHFHMWYRGSKGRWEVVHDEVLERVAAALEGEAAEALMYYSKGDQAVSSDSAS